VREPALDGVVGKVILPALVSPVVASIVSAVGTWLVFAITRALNVVLWKIPQVTFVQNFTDIDDKMIDRAHAEGIEVSLPELDAQGRVLLGPTEQGILDGIGWQETGHVFTRLLPDGDETAEMVTRILIEVLEVAHPADLDYLLRAHSDVS